MTGDNVEREELAAEFRRLLAETGRENATARLAEAQAFKAWQEGRLYPFVVFGAGSLFTLVLGAVVAVATAVILQWLGLPAK